MQVRRAAAAAAMEAGHQVPEGNALAQVAVAPTAGGAAKEPAGLPCPRCECTDTKFCYYNNYNLGQPRHFCKGCRRYWTRGGALRNVPVGGGTRKASPAARRKRASNSSSTASSATAPAAALLSSPAPLSVSAPAYATVRPYDLPPFMPALASPLAAWDPDRRLLDPERRLLDHNHRLLDPDRRLLDLGGSFTSLLAPATAPALDGHFPSTGFLVGGLPPMTPTPASSAPALLSPHPPVSSQALPEGLIWGMGWPDLSI